MSKKASRRLPRETNGFFITIKNEDKHIKESLAERQEVIFRYIVRITDSTLTLRVIPGDLRYTASARGTGCHVRSVAGHTELSVIPVT